jgi:Skp family chaperone for outer membrane proteins
MKHNPNLTFLFIKKNNLNYSECTIGRCFYLSDTLKSLHDKLTREKKQLESDITTLRTEISTLDATLNTKKENLKDRHSSDAYKNTPVIKRFSFFSSSEYNKYKIELEKQISELNKKITETTKKLNTLQLKLTNINTKLTSNMKPPSTLRHTEAYNKISFNFDSVVNFCQPSSGTIAAAGAGGGGGGNRNNLRVSKLKKILTKKSRKRPAKKSRKRPTKKSRKH